MSNGTTHKITASIGVGATWAIHELNETGEISAKPIIAGSIASVFASLPDVLEPALHPNHRQFFHGLAFAVIVGGITYNIYKWKPENTLENFIRLALLAIGGAYLIHLIFDANTPKGLPIIGRL